MSYIQDNLYQIKQHRSEKGLRKVKHILFNYNLENFFPNEALPIDEKTFTIFH